MFIINSVFDKYPLALAFQTLGLHLYGDQWTGNEIRDRRVADPTPVLKDREPLEMRKEELSLLINGAKRRQREVVGKEAIIEINRDIAQLDEERNQLAKQLIDIGEVQSGDKYDHSKWERFNDTEGYLLKGLGAGVITVIGSHGTVVKKELWQDLTDEFAFDWIRSLIFFPRTESGYMMQSGGITQAEFNEWLKTVPSHVTSKKETKEEIEAEAGIWLVEKIRRESGKTRDYYITEMRKKFDLSGNGARRVWVKFAPPNKKMPGRHPSN